MSIVWGGNLGTLLSSDGPLRRNLMAPDMTDQIEIMTVTSVCIAFTYWSFWSYSKVQNTAHNQFLKTDLEICCLRKQLLPLYSYVSFLSRLIKYLNFYVFFKCTTYREHVFTVVLYPCNSNSLCALAFLILPICVYVIPLCYD